MPYASLEAPGCPPTERLESHLDRETLSDMKSFLDWGTLNPAVLKPDVRQGSGKFSPGPGTIDGVMSPRNPFHYSS